MNLYKQWTETVIDFVKTHGEAAFWREYGSVETNIYTKLLANHKNTVKGVFKDLAAQYNTSEVFFMGFLDGINDSLTKSLDLENMTTETEIELNVDFEKLFFNMLDAKADYLYTLPQWEAIFSIEKRKEIAKAWRATKIVVNPTKVGRNEPCPCGSGKKYKQCCGKNA